MRALAVLITAGVLLLSVASNFVKQTRDALRQPLATNQEHYTVEPGKRLGTLLNDLKALGWIDTVPDPRLVSRLYPQYTSLKAGTYPAQGTLESLLVSAVAGKSVNYFFTIIPGWNLWQLQQALSSDTRLSQSLPSDIQDWQQALQIDQYPEGIFLPDTYSFNPGERDLDVLMRAHQALKQTLEESWTTRSTQQLASPEEALIMASIIEKETAVEAERQTIAGVFENRLRKGMKLQTDPTVIYGLLPDFDGNITRKNLREPTPYNTYTIKRLPPTPIAMPSVASIRAATQPEQHDYLYFVASGEGGHRFAESYQDHQKNVQQYLRKRRSAQ